MPRRLSFLGFLSLLIAACGGSNIVDITPPPDGSTDAGTCSGNAPLICDGCCGARYAADDCVGGAWTCRPLEVACPICDAGSDDSSEPPLDGSSDASSDAPDDVTEDTTGDATGCTGTPPVICNGCCGSKYAANDCVNGAWTCRPLGFACVNCDAGTDGDQGDAVSGGCGLAGEACCPGGDPGEIGAIAVAPCDTGLHCCAASNTCSIDCPDAGSDQDASSGACGARDDAGVAHTGACPAGQYCCDQSHTGATGFVCKDLGVACPLVP